MNQKFLLGIWIRISLWYRKHSPMTIYYRIFPFCSRSLKGFWVLSQYLIDNNLYDDYQSAYRSNHNVKTLLTNVLNFTLQEMDERRITAMVLFDLSSAFDTVYHEILLNGLASLGVQGQALEWFRWYLSFHSQIVRI